MGHRTRPARRSSARHEIIAEVLEASKDQWLPVMRTPDEADERTKARAAEIEAETAGIVMDRLRLLGFPTDSDEKFAAAVAEIHGELAVQIAFPEAPRDSGEAWDDRLRRARDAVEQIIETERLDARTLSDPALRDAAEQGDEQLFNKLYAEFVAKLTAEAIVPELKARHLWSEGNPRYVARLSGVVTQAISDAVESLVAQRQPQRRG